MRQSWPLFVSGMMLALVAVFVLRETQAENSLSRDNSGLRAKVPDFRALEGSIAAREKAMETKQLELKALEETLAQERKTLEEKISQMEKLRDEIKVYQEKNEALSDNILGRLVKTYETMEPKKAAGIISVMEDELAVEMLLKMKEKKVSSVLAVMDPSRAMQLSTLVANRRPAGRAVTNGRLNQK